MTKDEALKMALEALKGVLDDTPKVLDASIAGGLYEVVQCRDAICAIKEALAQPERSMKVEGPLHVVCQCDKCKAQPEQEPVAWWNDTGTHIDLNVSGRGTPLYTHPVKDLEDININITWNENSMRDFGKDELNFARAILRKAQEK